MDRLIAMQVFVEVAECGSMTLAAERLEMSRAMVSRHLESLESWLEARLFHRTTRRVSLTDIGLDSLAQCRQMLAMQEEIKARSSQRLQEPSGLLRITASSSFAESHLARAIAEYVKLHPRTRINLIATDRTINLIEERIDLAIRITKQPDTALHARKLCSCHSLLCASEAYIAQRGMPDNPMQLESHNCLTHSYHEQTLWVFRQGKKIFQPKVSGSISANEATALLGATLAGAGISLLPSYIAADYVRNGQLLHILPDCIPEVLGIYAVYSSHQHLPYTTRSFIDFLAREYSDPAYWELA